jgi:hypothetical protein
LTLPVGPEPAGWRPLEFGPTIARRPVSCADVLGGRAGNEIQPRSCPGIARGGSPLPGRDGQWHRRKRQYHQMLRAPGRRPHYVGAWVGHVGVPYCPRGARHSFASISPSVKLQ